MVFERGDLAGQRELLDQALPIAEVIGGSTLNRTLVALAWWEMNNGDPDKARRFAERGRQLAQAADMALDISRALQVLGAIAESAGNLDEAERLAQAHLDIADAMGHLHAQVIATELLGSIAFRRAELSDSTEQYRSAKSHLDEALVLSRRLGHRALDCNVVLGLAKVSVRLGDDPTARRYLSEALGLAIDIGAYTSVLECLTVEGDRRLATGDTETGLAVLGAVRGHPSMVATIEQSVDRTLSRCGLSPEEIAVGLARRRRPRPRRRRRRHAG